MYESGAQKSCIQKTNAIWFVFYSEAPLHPQIVNFVHFKYSYFFFLSKRNDYFIHDKRVVFVVNVSDGYIHCVDYKGGIKWVIKINTPRGIALYENRLFVASKIDSKVYQYKTHLFI
jgi:hypothetical protein